MSYYYNTSTSTSSTNYRWFIEKGWSNFEFEKHEIRSCNGCVYQLNKDRIFIKPNKDNPLHNVPLQCHGCYTWSVIDSIRENYKELDYSKKHLKEFIDEVFDEKDKL